MVSDVYLYDKKMILRKIKNKINYIFTDIVLATKRHIKPIYFHKNIKIVTPEKTTENLTYYIKNERDGAYFRFGDGEINMIEGKGAIEQDSDASLKNEMREALELSEENIMKSLMLNSPRFGFKEGKHVVSDKWANGLLKRSYQFFIGDKIYCHAALAYCFEYKKIEMKHLLDEIRMKDLKVFIGNKLIPKDILNLVFGENIIHIKIEPKNSYKDVDIIENNIIDILNRNKHNFHVLIFAAGPTSNILQKRLYGRYNTFSIDFGSLIDAIVGWNTRAWIKTDEENNDYYRKILEQL